MEFCQSRKVGTLVCCVSVNIYVYFCHCERRFCIYIVVYKTKLPFFFKLSGTQEPVATPIQKETPRIATFISPQNSPSHTVPPSTQKKKRRLRSKIEEPFMASPMEKGSTENTHTKDQSHEIVTRKLRTRRTKRDTSTYV